MAAVIVFAAITIVVTVAIFTSSSSDLPRISRTADLTSTLAKTLASIQATTNALDNSLNQQSADNKAVSRQYLAYMDALVKDCKTITFVNTRAIELQAPTELAGMVEQDFKLCNDLGKVAAYSANQYRAALPVLDARSTLRRYEKLPILSNHVVNNVRNTMKDSLAQLEKITVDPAIDRSSTSSLQQAIKGNTPSKEVRDPMVATTRLQDAQRQLLAQRVDFWQTQIGIDALQSAIQASMANSCSQLLLTSVRLASCN